MCYPECSFSPSGPVWSRHLKRRSTCLIGTSNKYTKGVEYGAGRKEKQKKTAEEIYDVVKEDMQRVSVTEEDPGDRGRWSAALTQRQQLEVCDDLMPMKAKACRTALLLVVSVCVFCVCTLAWSHVIHWNHFPVTFATCVSEKY